MSLTPFGIARAAYSQQVEPAPSRFTSDGAYSLWAARADAWAVERGLLKDWQRPEMYTLANYGRPPKVVAVT